MLEITIFNSAITGIHAKKLGSHPNATLNVLKDDKRPEENQCLKVVCPKEVPEANHRLICWPQNPNQMVATSSCIIIRYHQKQRSWLLGCCCRSLARDSIRIIRD